MASLFERENQEVRILDAGAGVGVLFSACVEALAGQEQTPNLIQVVAYENDDTMLPYLEYAMDQCKRICEQSSIDFKGHIRAESFIRAGVSHSAENLFSENGVPFTHAILNPPYKKIHARSNDRKLLNSAGVGVSNLYAAFVWLAAKMLAKGGELVAITPRSFCNGPYFRNFRRAMLGTMSMRRIHVFNSRKSAFGDDDVLQENIIFHAIRGIPNPPTVVISSSDGLDFENSSSRTVGFGDFVMSGDRDSFIHLASDESDDKTVERMSDFRTSLTELGLSVSTGRVVDFRAEEFLRPEAAADAVPLIYPCHFDNGFVSWTAGTARKPDAIAVEDGSRNLLVDTGYYVLTKRFTSKEETRRVVAAVFDPSRVTSALIGFENHLNYFHANGRGMQPEIAKGLALFLNSSVLDRYFRLFSGHTQVNATDLRKMRYPSQNQLLSMGRRVGRVMPDQAGIDSILSEACEHHG